ncbi:MAG: NAD(P)-binding protein, partial [Calditrichaeota bacterium]|nr:NAD(P)-binding protein [Calditrichota bacterium]
MAKRVAIIGGGIAGLSAGIYLQRSGYDCTIFEMNKAPGGLCTAWNRADYIIDNCVHWLVGSSPASPLYQLWNEVVDLSQIQFVDFSELFRVEDTEGNQLVLFTDVDALEDELLRKAPEDSRLVRAFTKGIRNLTRYEMPVGKAPELMTWRDGLTELLRMLPHAPTLLRW